MSETKFTPGPWRVEFGRDTKTPRSITPVLRWDAFLRGALPVEANANLIAAAPELYGALDYIVRLWKTPGASNDLIGRMIAEGAIAPAMEALAKARGEA